MKSEQLRILKRLSKGIAEIEGIAAAIVFGSFARGDYGPKSDIDLLLIIKSEHKKDYVKEELIRRTEELERGIQPIIRTVKELKKTDTGLLKKAFREGKIILLRHFIKFNAFKLLNLKPFRIYSFDISKLKRSKKVKFSQALYGQKVGKYSYKGTVDKAGGIKLGSGCILVPEEKTKEMDTFFRSYKTKPETWETFV